MLRCLEKNLQLTRNMLADEAIWLDADYERIDILNTLIVHYRKAIKEVEDAD